MTTHDSVGVQPTPDAPGASGLSRALWATLVVALALLGIAVALASTRPSTDAADAPASAPSSVPTPTATDPAVPASTLTTTVADTTVASFLAAVATVQPADFAKVASGAILEELQNDAQELEANGWSRTGVAEVDGVTVLESDDAKGTATVEACVDSSDVATLDQNGDRLNPEGTARALNLYSLARTDGAWRVVSRTFPDDTAC